MPPVFKTPKDSPADVELVGAGVAFADAKGGIIVERAAVTMPELQDEEGKPLEGAKLTDAAKEYVKDRTDLEVVNVAEGKLDSLPQEAGQPADRPPAAEVAEQAYKDTYGEPDLDRLEDEAEASPPAVPTPLVDTKED